MKTLKKILKEAISGGAKVIRLKVGAVPECDTGGRMVKMRGVDPIESDYILMLYREMFENGSSLAASPQPKKGKLLVNGESGRGEYLLLALPREQTLLIIPPFGPEAMNVFEKLWRGAIGAEEARPVSNQQRLREPVHNVASKDDYQESEAGIDLTPPLFSTPSAPHLEAAAPMDKSNPLDDKKLDVDLSLGQGDFRVEKFAADNRISQPLASDLNRVQAGFPAQEAAAQGASIPGLNTGFEGFDLVKVEKPNLDAGPLRIVVPPVPPPPMDMGFDPFANLPKPDAAVDSGLSLDPLALRVEHNDDSQPDFNKIIAQNSVVGEAPHYPVGAVEIPMKINYGPNIKINAGDSAGHLPINEILDEVIKRKASDLHLTIGEPAALRVDGDIIRMKNWVINEQNMRAFFDPILPKTNLKEFVESNDTDFAYEYVGKERFRVNLYRDLNGVGAVMRRIPIEIPTIEKLDLPPSIVKFCDYNKGLILVTGPTGSGKTTTLASMIDYINRHRSKHIITIEDPIEFVHPQKQCLITQRQINSHTESFSRALRAALREDPDIVMIGEMRDLETVSIALETSETGHLVFGTLHTNTAIATVDRIVDQFPTEQQEQIRIMLAESLVGVVSQTLLKRKTGGRIAALEVLVSSHAVKANIREKKTHMLKSILQTKKSEGNSLLNESLIELIKKNIVDVNEAYFKAVDKAEFMMMLQQAGIPLKIQANSAA